MSQGRVATATTTSIRCLVRLPKVSGAKRNNLVYMGLTKVPGTVSPIRFTSNNLTAAIARRTRVQTDRYRILAKIVQDEGLDKKAGWLGVLARLVRSAPVPSRKRLEASMDRR